jgi:tetratricopeptide (TPR) repeat protein
VYLEELVARNAHADAAHFNLGRIYEQRGNPESALIEYALVGPGDDYLPAQVRQTEILFDSERAAEASSRLSRSREAQPDYAIQLYLIESEALANRQRLDESWKVIGQALEQFPGDTNLLYTRAMLAEKRGDLGGLERDLRSIIEREPDNATALNALGYTLADRTTRYDEAKALIEQAHKLNPEDAATLDSMGWVNYRMGNLEDAERYLRAALSKFPDHEVAAHLGEVLWAQGKQREARKVWAGALQTQPDSPILRSTIQRLTGSEKL